MKKFNLVLLLLASLTAFALVVTACSSEEDDDALPTATAVPTTTQPGVSGTTMQIPYGLTAQTTGPTKSDGIYTPTTNREIYQKISADYLEIVKLTNQVTEGKPLPAAQILLLYEAGMHTRIGTSSRSLRVFAREAARATEFPDSAAFYKNPAFLDTEINDAITKARTAANYTDAQRRQAIQKGIQRIIYHWSKRYIQQAAGTLNPGLVDEAWAIYVGEEKDGKYPNSLAATALGRETNFNRPGSLDNALRTAMSQAQKAAADKNQAAYDAAAKEIYSRFNAIFYLGTVRYFNEALKSAQGGNAENAGAQLVEGWSFYLSIQPEVAKFDAAVDKTVTDFFKTEPAKLTAEMRNAALAAINKAAGALLLKPADLVTPATFQ